MTRKSRQPARTPTASPKGIPTGPDSSGNRSRKASTVELATATSARTVKMPIMASGISFWRTKVRPLVSYTTANAPSIAPNRPEPTHRKPANAISPNRPDRCLTPLIASRAGCCWSGGKRLATSRLMLSAEIPAAPGKRPPAATRARAIGKMAVRAFQAIRTPWLPPPSAMNFRTTRTRNRLPNAATWSRWHSEQPLRSAGIDSRLCCPVRVSTAAIRPGRSLPGRLSGGIIKPCPPLNIGLEPQGGLAHGRDDQRGTHRGRAKGPRRDDQRGGPPSPELAPHHMEHDGGTGSNRRCRPPGRSGHGGVPLDRRPDAGGAHAKGRALPGRRGVHRSLLQEGVRRGPAVAGAPSTGHVTQLPSRHEVGPDR